MFKGFNEIQFNRKDSEFIRDELAYWEVEPHEVGLRFKYQPTIFFEGSEPYSAAIFTPVHPTLYAWGFKTLRTAIVVKAIEHRLGLTDGQR